jgi:hypothetical protein
MTLQEALAIAAQARPKHRQPLDKLQTGISADQIAAGVTALNKSYDAMGGTVAEMQKQLDRARAGVALVADVMNINITTETMQ